MQNIAEIKKNEEKNGIEIYFKVYPLSGTKETMKKHGFRWNGKKSCWYAKYSADAADIAGIIADTSVSEYQNIANQNGEEIKEIGAKKATPAKQAQPETINLDNLGENRPHLYGAELAKAIREDLKRRGVKGVTVRSRKVTHDTGITVTIKATPEDYASIEEAGKRYTFSKFCFDAESRPGLYIKDRWVSPGDFYAMTDAEKEQAYNDYLVYHIKKADSVSKYDLDDDKRDLCFEFTSIFYEKLRAVYLIADQWNYDNSDSMTDYFDVGYYLDIDIKQPEELTIRETMTDTEREAYNAEMAQRKAENEARIKAYEEEQARLEKERKEYEEWRSGAMDRIENNITVEDLPEAEQIYIENLKMGIGKECSLDELKEQIADHYYTRDALITRTVTFTDETAYNDFCKLFMQDFEWVKGMGGTATEDVRTEGVNFYTLTEEQRESIKFYCSNCIAVYLNDKLSLVLDPQGYGYARYVLLPDEDSHIYKASSELEKQRKDSEKKEPFYFPETVEKQAENIKEGQDITVYQCDGWILNSIYGGFGTVTGVHSGDYAQYKGVYIGLKQGKKEKTVFIRDNHKCLIYNGILPPLPAEVTEQKITDNMSLLHNEDVLFKNAYKYYAERGILPIVDTWQR